MTKSEIHKIATDALLELQFNDWNVSTVWQKRTPSPHFSHQSPAKQNVTWVIDFTNKEGTYPRVFFLFAEESGKNWVKLEIKRQLVELKERSLFQKSSHTSADRRAEFAATRNDSVSAPASIQRRMQKKLDSPQGGPDPLIAGQQVLRKNEERPLPLTDSQSKPTPEQIRTLAKRQRIVLSQHGCSPILVENQNPVFWGAPRVIGIWISRAAIIVVGIIGGYLSLKFLAETHKSAPEDTQLLQPQTNIGPSGRPATAVAPQDQLKIIDPSWSNLATTSEQPDQKAALSESKSAEPTELSKKKTIGWNYLKRSQVAVSSFFTAALEPSSATAQGGREGDNSELNAALSEWISACEKHDVKKQLSFYAGNINEYKANKNVPREDVEFDKERALDRSAEVKVTAARPVISSDPAGKTASVLISKSVNNKGNGISEKGTQELRWQKTRSGWKIIAEKDLILAQ